MKLQNANTKWQKIALASIDNIDLVDENKADIWQNTQILIEQCKGQGYN